MARNLKTVTQMDKISQRTNKSVLYWIFLSLTCPYSLSSYTYSMIIKMLDKRRLLFENMTGIFFKQVISCITKK